MKEQEIYEQLLPSLGEERARLLAKVFYKFYEEIRNMYNPSNENNDQLLSKQLTQEAPPNPKDNSDG